jgi:hypothetical protein
MGNWNSLESYDKDVVKCNTGYSVAPYSYQVIQVDGFITMGLDLERVTIHDMLV